jgi:hypothetical protein
MSAHRSASLRDAAERLQELIVKPTIHQPDCILVAEQAVESVLLENEETGPALPAAANAITSNTADDLDETTEEVLLDEEASSGRFF